jgi:hypothetical protein
MLVNFSSVTFTDRQALLTLSSACVRSLVALRGAELTISQYSGMDSMLIQSSEFVVWCTTSVLTLLSHASHVTYPSNGLGGDCPDGFPYRLPQMEVGTSLYFRSVSRCSPLV